MMEILKMEETCSSPPTNGEKLPQIFNVRYLGFREAKGLWGIKHTRGPVETMVISVKELKTSLNIMKLIVGEEGCKLESIFKGKIENRFFPIDSISYGVQDLIYTRVFSMIMVKQVTDFPDQSPFQCHAFICESRLAARKLTHALAAAFYQYSLKVKSVTPAKVVNNRRKFGVDLRSPEELQCDLQMQETEA